MSGVSVREARALAIGIAAAHGATQRSGWPCPCAACATYGDAIRAAIAGRYAAQADVAPLAVAGIVLFDELRREAAEAEARG